LLGTVMAELARNTIAASQALPEMDGYAIASLVFGILAIPTFGVLSGPAIYLSGEARNRLRAADMRRGQAAARAGFILGLIGGVIGIISLVTIALVYALTGPAFAGGAAP
jgi:hypothetical protein